MSSNAPSPPQEHLLHFAALETLMESDRALAHAPEMAIDEPHRLEQITPSWLEEIMAKNTQGARLLELTSTDAHDGMTDRGKWSLVWNDVGKAADLPANIFVKATPHPPLHREMLSVLHMDEAEVKFYRDIHPEIPGVAPDAYYFKSYGGGRSIIILEDLVERGCRPYVQGDELTLAHAKAVAVTQAKFHAQFWGSDRFTQDLTWIRPRTCRFGWPWLFNTHADVRQLFIDTASSSELPPHAAETLKYWHKHAWDFFHQWDTKPLTMAHGDSHIGNTYSRPDGSAGYYDWQVIFAANGLRDLAYFLYSGFIDDMRHQHEREVFDLYIDTLKDYGVKLDRENAWNDFCLFSIDRWDAAIMAFVHGTYGHSREGQLRQFNTVAGGLIDNDVLGRLRSAARHIG